MPREVVLPELAESVVEGEILKWLVNEGDSVALEQPIVEVMTDKVTVELPSPFAGTLQKKLVQEGEIVAVHAAIAVIAEAGETAGAPVQAAASMATATSIPAHAGASSAQQAVQESFENPTTAHVTLPVTAQEERSIVESGSQEDKGDDQSLFKAFASDEKLSVPTGLGRGGQSGNTAATQHGRVLAVPAARQLARELDVDLSQVQGSGPNGRVRVTDVHNYAMKQAQAAQPQAKAPTGSGMPVAPVQYKTPKGYEALESRTPLRGMRRAISNQMLASHLYTVRTLTVDEANLSKLVALRERLKGGAEASGVKLSYLPFIFKAIATALQKYPSLNTSFDEAAQEIVQKRYYNLGMAVATDAGLIVPVIRDVERKSVLQLAREILDLGTRARDGKLTPDEMAGSSFSVTNIGSIGALFSFPIINVPDAAIMGIHSIVKRPVFDENDQVVPGHMMYLSLSFDHRLVDGAEAARFCKEVIRLLENPETLLLEAI
ncbi:dihydrolipoamide acetyltransferase family protein [Deinococcus peraridilitoris]|uniref:Dihydrolipoamide acetyltransferase component of pyruvate dehydrogenase complex n=1 Tax=Deinococcus peraridilitoris (strain DSM 19664 / LMG 22246 / CIP 109416 / KR-200) TaxID=937777 RepID=K9ZZV9_DEIPD|nr:dihydrolipoamide acetyltransferase family protein [Deinococcus peraridilitoris]AFZ66734.1 pyruvate/2-oxoglutarate dehydrogenase complex, dihydrolipoamide acyltransferase component [Deinococcus peraridilitoris DSM 19664]